MRKKLLPEERKAQIIQIALKLFAEKGYENITVNNIIDEAGLSKGGFYHHYDSKEELLEDIAQMFIGEVVTMVGEIAARDDLTALQKTNEYIKQVNVYKEGKTVEVTAFLSELYAEGKNIQLENKIFGYAKKQIAPLLKEIIVQGIQEGEFMTDYPEEAAELYIKLFLFHQQEMSELFYQALQERNNERLETIRRKYRFLQRLLEDILGLKAGSLILEEVMIDAVRTIGQSILNDFDSEKG